MTKLPNISRPNLASLSVLGGVSTLLACSLGPVSMGNSVNGEGLSATGTSTAGTASTGPVNPTPKTIDVTTIPVEAGAGGAPGEGSTACSDTLLVVYRDFRGWKDSSGNKHPDFENVLGDDRGIVQPMLGSDQKPVYAHSGATKTVSGAASFNQWYRDTAGVNMRIEKTLQLTPLATDPSTKGYSSSAFFPLNGIGFGNQGQRNNFSFTTEIHTSFTYKGGEVFSFDGDDDVFTYVDNKLVIDLGGVHTAEKQTIDFDQHAAELGLVKGNTYTMDIFHAERHTSQSDFTMETKFDCLVSRIIP